jgi:antitoxin component YwqK of YwqJK toxin-antitoxin module
LTFGQNQDSNQYITEFEYYDNGDVSMKYKTFQGVKVDTLIAFDSKGRIQAILYFGEHGSTAPIYREDHYYTGAARKSTGYYMLTEDSETVNVGIWKYYWKNGSIMDSVVYENSGIEKYRARFGKNGSLQFESTVAERKIYNRDGSVRLIEKK